MHYRRQLGIRIPYYIDLATDQDMVTIKLNKVKQTIITQILYFHLHGSITKYHRLCQGKVLIISIC